MTHIVHAKPSSSLLPLTWRRAAALFVSTLCVAACLEPIDSTVTDVTDVTDDSDSNNAQLITAASATLWKTRNIPVCWENPTPGDGGDRGLVQRLVQSTWSQATLITFTGWQTCTATSKGIRINIADVAPHTIALGANLDGVVNGMTLNFKFRAWQPTIAGISGGSRWSGAQCPTTFKGLCVTNSALHEFGHALGLTHEEPPAGGIRNCVEPNFAAYSDVTIGGWDSTAVMNYCSPQWSGPPSGFGRYLSLSEVAAIRLLYPDVTLLLGAATGGLAANQGGVVDAPAFVAELNANRIALQTFQVVPGDFNGDGKTDIYLHGRPGSGAGDYMALSTGTTFHLWTWAWPFGAAANWNGWEAYAADFNGDGKDDLYIHGSPGLPAADAMALSTGTAFEFFTWYRPFDSTSNWPSNFEVKIGDVNGDRKADIYLHGRPGSGAGDYLALATGTGFEVQSWPVAATANWNSWEAHLADFDGDGKADLYLHGRPGTGVADYLGVSTGTGFQTWTWALPSGPATWNDFMVSTGDVNGDGKADLYLDAIPVSGLSDYLGTSTGTNFLISAVDQNSGSTALLADFNGDRRADRLLTFPGTDFPALGADWVGLWTGAAFRRVSVQMSPSRSSGMGRVVGDFNGDGRKDVLRIPLW